MIVFDHVSKVYPNGTVGLDDVNLTIGDGEFVAIIGRSGAGKSTLLRAVNRMHRITAGTLTVNGTDVSTLSGKALRQFRRGIGMVFQSFNLFPQYTVLGNVTLAGRLLAKERPDFKSRKAAIYQEIEENGKALLDSVGLLAKLNAYPHQLSGGQQQRVAIARALAGRPAVLLASMER